MKNVYKQKRQEGFTIIEVLIVLAIAALILLIVFLAVPNLQRNSRNTQRKNDVANIAAAMSNFAGNNNGAAPTAYDWVASDPTNMILYCKGAGTTLSGTVTITGTGHASPASAPLLGCLTTNKNFDSAKLGYYKPSDLLIFYANSNATPSVVASGSTESATNVSSNSIIIDLGFTCGSDNASVGVASSRASAIFYVSEASTGFGNLTCVQA